jgi:hypothetical protein
LTPAQLAKVAALPFRLGETRPIATAVRHHALAQLLALAASHTLRKNGARERYFNNRISVLSFIAPDSAGTKSMIEKFFLRRNSQHSLCGIFLEPFLTVVFTTSCARLIEALCSQALPPVNT